MVSMCVSDRGLCSVWSGLAWGGGGGAGVGVGVFFQAEDGIRDLVRSRGLGDVYKRQAIIWPPASLRHGRPSSSSAFPSTGMACGSSPASPWGRCLLYTSDAADERSSVDLGGRRIL